MMDRKTFIKKTASVLLLAAPTYTLLSCSSSSDNSNPINNNTPDCLANGASASNISSNHGHSLTVSSSDVNSGVEKTYDISGSAGHSHSITVTSTNFNTLKNNSPITLNSTTGNSHSHSVTISCA